ncbi:MAG: DNA mismatch repair endonuclease MutL [Bacilli bacterium]|nr:DNA mismatch repair endonuclease MutL [Bacilli bacterium]
MAIIKVMDEILANKIAAGEVVERCASVVKELVENSIDAGSTDIKVELIESGVKQIKVTDNGKGMDKEDAILSFSRHATSKIMDEDDLFHIHTLGFRGEALASIASVSKVTLTTSTGGVGTIVKINGGKIVSVDKGDARIGTIMCVDELFYNTPARLKYLKSLYTELSHITDYMNKLALSHNNIRFTLINDGKTLLQTDGSGNVLKTIKNIYGIGVAKKMLEVSSHNNDYEVTGYISLPEVYKSNRNCMITIVNGRVVRNTELNKKINDAYSSYKPDNYYPITVLDIKVDTTLIDVNIHPTKMDVKFSKLDELMDLVYQMIRDKISKKTLIPHIEDKPIIIEPKKQYIENTLDFDGVDTVFEDTNEYVINDDFIDNNDEISNNDIPIQTHQDEKEKLPMMYPVGLVHGTYIICQNEQGMYLIDQHAAKERINYEMFKYKVSHPSGESISMIVPLTMELSNNDFLIIKENFDLLRNMNFEVEEFGLNSIIIKRHPTWIFHKYEHDDIKRIIDIIIHQEKNFDLGKFYDHVAATLACKASIKANTNITMEEMENLINDLRKCENPFNCPHGRPTTVYYSSSDLEKLFKRSGF